ncbi:MAG: type IX secretion system membrane protein PorP/SprF [Bacteroidota bacterium]|nr:type IX secretion system membrane protein PorP/SprF [Bacteroidota bacterium]
MKKLFLLCSALIAFTSLKLSAQQDPQFTHYMYNTLSVNPAYAGSRDVLNISALHRQQWIGLNGAPTTQTVFIHSPLKNKKMGLGFSVVNDHIGPINQTFFYGDYSYTVKLTEGLRLSFGVKAGVNWFQPKIAELSTIQANDPSFTGSTLQSNVKPNFGAGIYLHHENWYFGASAPRLVQNTFSLGGTKNDTTSLMELRHLFVIGGVILPITPDIKLKPTFQIKMVKNSPISIDATVEALFREKFSVGLGMRYKDSYYGLVGYQLSSQFRAGISYDYTSTRLQNVNNGTVEIMLSYDFLNKQDKLRSPRYF